MTSQHVPVAGGCLCGAVRYESSVAPTEGYYCHCRMCQKHYGGLFGATARFSGATFQFTRNQPKFHQSSDVARRGFCPDCGTPMAFAFAGNPDLWISIGSLDHPEDWPLTRDARWGPITHTHVDSKVAWHEIADGLPQRTSESAVLLQAAKAFVARTKQ
jgi:hypothetical protein